MSTGTVILAFKPLPMLPPIFRLWLWWALGGLAYVYGMQMLLVAAGNVWWGTLAFYRYLAWPTRLCQQKLGGTPPQQLIALGQ